MCFLTWNWISIWKVTEAFLFCCLLSFSAYRFMAFSCYSLHLIRVPNNNISIWTNSNPAFSWIQVEDFGSIGAGDSYKLAFIHLTCGLKTTLLEQNIYKIETEYSECWMEKRKKANNAVVQWIPSSFSATRSPFPYTLMPVCFFTSPTNFHLNILMNVELRCIYKYSKSN